MEPVLDIRGIIGRLPHRYPMVLIDRIVELNEGERIVALKNVTYNEPFFMGHFPANPIMPGVLIVEAMGQAGGVLVSASKPSASSPESVYFMGFDKVRFRKPVVPGDQLIIEVKFLKQRMSAIKMAAQAFVDGILVAEAEFLATFGELSA